MKLPKRRLGFESLEDRSLLSAMPLGTPWPDAAALSLSFAPDSTAIGGRESELFEALDDIGSDDDGDGDDWQREILRAFQSWAVHSNINLAVAKDSGDAFGSPGDTQGDTRFGDIRIGAMRLATDSLANVSPYDWSIGTWSGDVLLNSASRFGLNAAAGAKAADLYTVLLHEAGHVFGLEHSDDPASAVTERYAGPKLTPAAEDIIALQANYGARTPDSYEGTTGNDSRPTAVRMSGDESWSAVADLTNRADTDYFAFTAPTDAKKFSVRVRTAGLSSLVPKLTVYDAAGQVVGSATGDDPLNPRDLEVKLNGTGGATYYARVAGATDDVFAIGRYEIRVDYRKVTAMGRPTFDKDGGADDTIVGATVLQPGRMNGNRYAENAVVEKKTDVDFYRVSAPSVASGTADALTIQVRGVASKGTPALAVYDEDGARIPAQVVSNSGMSLTVQVPGVRRGADYFVRVSSVDGTDTGTGNYRLTANFGPVKDSGLSLLQSGWLSATESSRGTLTVTNGRLFQFGLTTTGDAGAVVNLTVLDDRGRAVFTVRQSVNERPTNETVYLPTGTYRVVISTTGLRPTGVGRFWLFAGVFSDPVGPYATTVGGTGSTSTGTGTGYTYTGTTTPLPVGYYVTL